MWQKSTQPCKGIILQLKLKKKPKKPKTRSGVSPIPTVSVSGQPDRTVFIRWDEGWPSSNLRCFLLSRSLHLLVRTLTSERNLRDRRVLVSFSRVTVWPSPSPPWREAQLQVSWDWVAESWEDESLKAVNQHCSSWHLPVQILELQRWLGTEGKTLPWDFVNLCCI